MDYFRILNLKKEPFSNSPEPEFFFQSSQHLGCLQKLELAIRLQRGLNVVIGDVGTGKTTLCRQLILRFSGTEEDRSQLETHLIMDPAFSSAIEFLMTVALALGMPAANTSEWQYKENIKNYLFRRGVNEGKIVVLIIDEGQKLPDFCLEVLREFLNYETNTNKLLQIVIFAQKEFEEILEKHAGFTDRINLFYLLKPLNFRETKKLIRYRLAQAAEDASPSSYFSYPGLWAVYLSTRGYPRKIITICHQVMLALIIQNRTKAGYFLVRSSARRLLPLRLRRRVPRWAFSTALIVLFAVLLASRVTPEWTRTIVPDLGGRKNTAPLPVTADIAGTEAVGSASKQAIAPVPEQFTASLPTSVVQNKQENMPHILGRLTIIRRDTVLGILKKMYGEPRREGIPILIQANPQIRNADYVRAGDVLTVPALPPKPAAALLGKGMFLAQIDRTDHLDEAYRSLTLHPDHLPPIRLVPYWNKREGLVLAMVLRERFPDEKSCRQAIAALPYSVARRPQVIGQWDAGTVCFCY